MPRLRETDRLATGHRTTLIVSVNSATTDGCAPLKDRSRPQFRTPGNRVACSDCSVRRRPSGRSNVLTTTETRGVMLFRGGARFVRNVDADLAKDCRERSCS